MSYVKKIGTVSQDRITLIKAANCRLERYLAKKNMIATKKVKVSHSSKELTQRPFGKLSSYNINK